MVASFAKDDDFRSRILVIGLAIIVFPFLVALAFYSSSNLIPSLTKFQFTLPFNSQNNTAVTQNTVLRRELNGTVPKFLNLSLPGIPRVTYEFILVLVAAAVAAYLLIQAFKAIKHRRSVKPLADIDELILEREKVASILDETVRRLSGGSNYRETVLKCYKLIAAALELRSSTNGKAMTPREFREIVSQKLKFDSPYLGRVTSLFEIARYSQNEISQKEANDATECLSELSSELRELKNEPRDIISE